MKKLRVFMVVVLLLVPLLWLRADKTFTIEDVLRYERIRSFEFSPDGTMVLWIQSSPDKEKNRYLSHIWISYLDKPEPIQLTRGKNSEYAARWSPDGRKIAFISDRDKKPQVYLLRLPGGEPEKLTDFEKGVNAFEWKDSENLLILAREKEYKEERDRKKKKDDAIVVEDIRYFYPVRLFLFNIKTKKVKRLTNNRDRIVSLSVSPSGRYVITTHIQSPSYVAEPEHRPVYFLHDLETGKSKEIFKDKYFSPTEFVWYDDDTVFFLEEKSRREDKRGPGIFLLYRYSVSKDSYEQIPLNWDWGVGGLYLGRLDVGGNWLAVALAKGAVNPILLMKIDKKKSPAKWKRYLLDDHLCTHFMGFKLSRDGRKIAFIYTTASTPPQLYYGLVKKGRIIKKAQITDINSYLKDRFIAKTEVIRWKSEGGREIEGILYYPKGYKPGKRYPLIVNIHGGPAGYDADWFENSWAYYPHYYAAKGAFVLFVNYSGSSNYGLDFVESIFGHYYELEIPDILSGINYLIEKGMVDKDRLGVMGWSNGAILTIELTVRTNMFKAASPGAGDVNWISDYGNCKFGPQFDELYFKGPPWKELQHYIEKSPLFKLERVTTPTLIMFGTADTNVPTEQGWQHFRALKRIGKAPVKFILFPGEPHSLRKLSHQRRKLEEETAWFDKYLFGKKVEEAPLYDKTSPLAAKIALKKAAKVNGRYGVEINGILVPETIEVDGIKIGRFEVTRAQFEYYLRENPGKAEPLGWDGEKFQPLTDNYPVSRIPYEVALDYCRWLSKKTGKKFRLPTEEEMKKLLKKAKGKENVLNYWVGYDPNPEEAEKVREEVEEKFGHGALILPVGSMGPSYKGIFDINGNVAEWVTTPDGKGKVMGLAANTAKDSKGKPSKICRCYTGFRVVEEK